MEQVTFDLKRLVRPNILDLEPYHSAREKIQSGVLLDANENPFPMEWGGAQLNRYPDPAQRALREALAGYTGAGFDQVLAGAGSDEVLDWVFKVFCEPGKDRVAVAEPTYGMYRVMADIFGVELYEWRLDDQFDLEADRFLASVPSGVKVLFLCSPNNPTGNLLSAAQIVSLCRKWGGLVVLDEAYIEFADHPSLAGRVAELPNLLVMRTLSKAFGRAGLRLGYAVAHPQIISCFLKVKFPYNLSTLAQQQGVAALQAAETAAHQIKVLRSQRDRMAEALRQMEGVKHVFPSAANFLLFRCPYSRQVYSRLFQRGVIVRDRSGMPGLQDCIRVSVGTEEENDIFLDALAETLREDLPEPPRERKQ